MKHVITFELEAKFEYCFCSDNCPQKRFGSQCHLPYQMPQGYLIIGTMPNQALPISEEVPKKYKIRIDSRLKYAHVRTKRCCELFGV